MSSPPRDQVTIFHDAEGGRRSTETDTENPRSQSDNITESRWFVFKMQHEYKTHSNSSGSILNSAEHSALPTFWLFHKLAWREVPPAELAFQGDDEDLAIAQRWAEQSGARLTVVETNQSYITGVGTGSTITSSSESEGTSFGRQTFGTSAGVPSPTNKNNNINNKDPMSIGWATQFKKNAHKWRRLADERKRRALAKAKGSGSSTGSETSSKKEEEAKPKKQKEMSFMRLFMTESVLDAWAFRDVWRARYRSSLLGRFILVLAVALTIYLSSTKISLLSLDDKHYKQITIDDFHYDLDWVNEAPSIMIKIGHHSKHSQNKVMNQPEDADESMWHKQYIVPDTDAEDTDAISNLLNNTNSSTTNNITHRQLQQTSTTNVTTNSSSQATKSKTKKVLKQLWDLTIRERIICDGYEDFNCESTSNVIWSYQDLLRWKKKETFKEYTEKYGLGWYYMDYSVKSQTVFKESIKYGDTIGVNMMDTDRNKNWNTTSTNQSTLQIQGSFGDPKYRFLEFKLESCRKDLFERDEETDQVISGRRNFAWDWKFTYFSEDDPQPECGKREDIIWAINKQHVDVNAWIKQPLTAIDWKYNNAVWKMLMYLQLETRVSKTQEIFLRQRNAVINSPFEGFQALHYLGVTDEKMNWVDVQYLTTDKDLQQSRSPRDKIWAMYIRVWHDRSEEEVHFDSYVSVIGDFGSIWSGIAIWFSSAALWVNQWLLRRDSQRWAKQYQVQVENAEWMQIHDNDKYQKILDRGNISEHLRCLYLYVESATGKSLDDVIDDEKMLRQTSRYFSVISGEGREEDGHEHGDGKVRTSMLGFPLKDQQRQSGGGSRGGSRVGSRSGSPVGRDKHSRETTVWQDAKSVYAKRQQSQNKGQSRSIISVDQLREGEHVNEEEPELTINSPNNNATKNNVHKEEIN